MSSGAVRYFTGRPCTRGHVAERNTKSGACSECSRQHCRRRYWGDPKNARARVSRYAAENAELLRARRKLKHQDPDFKRKNRERVRQYRSTAKGRLNHRMSERIAKGLCGRRLGKNWQSLLGYTVEELRSHLERQFTKGMSWSNIGRWHIDHILPLALFSYTTADDPEFRAAWAITNLRPLWAPRNMQKHARRETLL